MRSRMAGLIAIITLAIGVLACGEPAPSPGPTDALPSAAALQPLDLVIRNSGLPGGFVLVSVTGQPTVGRWHSFGMAELLCLTCPEPFNASGPSYELVVVDEACKVMSVNRTLGGDLWLEIDPGPIVRLGEAPPPGDWIPSESPPMEASTPPCATPPSG